LIFTAEDVLKDIQTYYAQNTISADSFARSLEFMINQPEDMDVNEILFPPTAQQQQKTYFLFRKVSELSETIKRGCA